MVLYMHVILFFICINLGLGFTAIPDTPLYIGNATSSTAYDCYTQNVHLLLEWDTTNQKWVPTGPVDPNDPLQEGDDSTRDIANLGDYMNTFGGSYDPITEALSIGYNTLNIAKGILLGGFVTNTIESITMTCDWSGSPYVTDEDNYNANFGQPVTNVVISYFVVAIQLIFGFMLFLAIIYLLTGKSFGL